MQQDTYNGLPYLSPIFSSHMVMQRDQEDRVWGWTQPGSTVTVQFGGRKAKAVADLNGLWLARIKPPKAGGPYALDIDGPKHLELSDVMVGDVWFCSGQSNMQFGVGVGNNGAEEIKNANYPEIRLCSVNQITAIKPLPTTDAPWTVCSPDTVGKGGWGGFSAAAYFFGRELNQRLKEPIGLIHCSWGGTPGEAWISEPELRKIGDKDFDNVLDMIDDANKPGAPTEAERFDQWFESNDPGTSGHWDNPATPVDDWTDAPLLGTFRQALGRWFSGVVWFRYEVNLPDPLDDNGAWIQMANVNGSATFWVNGKLLGSNNSSWCSYGLARGILQPGKNVIVVRLLGAGDQAGFPDDTSNHFIQLGNGVKVLLAGGKFKVGHELTNYWSQAPYSIEHNSQAASTIYNGMVQPFSPMAIKGVLWYQGEQNVGRAAQYRRILPALFEDWRRAFEEPKLPFFIAQLANFQRTSDTPTDDAWAELRESQAWAVAHDRHAGLACLIDIGDHNDIHPKNKQDVGHRLAIAALKVVYGVDLPYSGPVFKKLEIDGSSIRVTFGNTDGGLKFKSALRTGFAIAGADKVFYWADARIEGDSVVLKAAKVLHPVAVRYGWDADPVAPLYNGANLPAVPFRTDDWAQTSGG
jgi:sialate O-acetylesterase